MQQSEFQLKLVGQLNDLKLFSRRYTMDKNEANDLVQETVLKALRFWCSFKEDTNFRGWLRRIMKNTFIDLYQSKKRQQSESLSGDVLPKEVYLLSANNLAENAFAMDVIQNAIDKLDKQYSVPFMMFFEGYRYHEIADRLSVPIGTIKTRIYIARQILKKELSSFRNYSQTA